MAGEKETLLPDVKASGEQMSLLPVCVLAGGLGTRLGDVTRTVPKPLVEVAGAPFVFHQLRLLSDSGASRVVLCVGYLGEMIEATVGSSRFGLEISYSYDSPSPAGTLAAIKGALPLLGDRFLVLYGDTYLPIDYLDVQRKWFESGLPAMMTVLHNENLWGRSNASFKDGRVVAYDKVAPSADMSWIDYGLGGLTAALLDTAPSGESEVSALYGLLALNGDLFGCEVSERFHEIGTPKALAETSAYLAPQNYP